MHQHRGDKNPFNQKRNGNQQDSRNSNLADKSWHKVSPKNKDFHFDRKLHDDSKPSASTVPIAPENQASGKTNTGFGSKPTGNAFSSFNFTSNSNTRAPRPNHFNPVFASNLHSFPNRNNAPFFASEKGPVSLNQFNRPPPIETKAKKFDINSKFNGKTKIGDSGDAYKPIGNFGGTRKPIETFANKGFNRVLLKRESVKHDDESDKVEQSKSIKDKSKSETAESPEKETQAEKPLFEEVQAEKSLTEEAQVEKPKKVQVEKPLTEEAQAKKQLTEEVQAEKPKEAEKKLVEEVDFRCLLVDSFNQGFCGTFVFKVGSKSLRVSKLFFVAQSDVFKSLMQSNSEEAKSGEKKLDEYAFEAVEQLVNFIHLGEAKHLDQYAEQLSSLANMFGLEKLKAICAPYLVSTGKQC